MLRIKTREKLAQILDKVGLEDLKDQCGTVEDVTERLIEEKREFADPENVERCNNDIENLDGLEILLRRLIVTLEDDKK